VSQKQEEVLRGLSRNQSLFRQRNAEGALDPEQQLHPGQTVEPEVLLEAPVERDDWFCLRPQLGRKACNDPQQALLLSRLRYGWGDFREMVLDGDALSFDAEPEKHRLRPPARSRVDQDQLRFTAICFHPPVLPATPAGRRMLRIVSPEAPASPRVRSP
jgi:hypothetical protein